MSGKTLMERERETVWPLYEGGKKRQLFGKLISCAHHQQMNCYYYYDYYYYYYGYAVDFVCKFEQ